MQHYQAQLGSELNSPPYPPYLLLIDAVHLHLFFSVPFL